MGLKSKSECTERNPLDESEVTVEMDDLTGRPLDVQVKRVQYTQMIELIGEIFVMSCADVAAFEKLFAMKQLCCHMGWSVVELAVLSQTLFGADVSGLADLSQSKETTND